MSSETPLTNGDNSHPIETNGASPHSPLQAIPRTKLIFQAAEHQETYDYDTKITSITPFIDLSPQDQSLFNASTAPTGTTLYALTTEATIFHPQGGGQPSDTGHFSLQSSSTNDEINPLFTVLSARVSSTYAGLVLHIGHFTSPSALPTPPTAVTQHISPTNRHLFSRLHTAGHVLGTTTRTLLESQIPNFDELKASHFPNAASCEFQGSIDGKHKAAIQSGVDELVGRDAPVRIEWWTKGEFRGRGLMRLVPEDRVWREIGVWVDGEGRDVEKGEGKDEDGDEDEDEKTRIRVVNIVGAEVYPCGGTHVAGTKGCGKVVVKKISRAKKNSRVSYSVE